jgi:hypothetical protein
VFLNIGYFFRKTAANGWNQQPEFFTLPREFIQAHHYQPESGFQKVRTRGLDLSAYKDELGFEQIARDLAVPYPRRAD